jgi:pimeloyl-ACP methyl ester carboxylesterase
VNPLDLMRITKLMLKGERLPITRTPAEAGLAYEDVTFTATDGVQLKGWFVPAATTDGGPAPAVVFVHGWLWNRMGNVGGRVPFRDRDVDFLPPTKALHDAGVSVLLFDLPNHGESGSRFPIDLGCTESHDFVGAVAYLRGRADVDPARIGAVGTSMGGNAVLIGAPDAQPLKAALLVQPTIPYQFSRKFSKDVLGRLGTVSLPMVDLMYAAFRAPRPSQIDPGKSARLLTDTQLKYVQGTGDPWGSMDIVQSFVDRSPKALPLVKYPSTGRYEGYRYVTEHADEVAAYFAEYL